MVLTQPVGQFDASSFRHLYIEQGNISPISPAIDPFSHLPAAAGFHHDDNFAGALQQLPDSPPDDGMVVGE